MDIKEGHQTLESIRKKQAVGTKPEELGYFRERGLVSVMNSEHYNGLPSLLEEGVSLYGEIEKADWLNRKLSGISHDSQRILDGTTPYIMEMPDAGYMNLARYEQFLKLLARSKSRWHRFWSQEKTLEDEKEQLDALTNEVRTALERADQELRDVQSTLPTMQSQYADLVDKLNGIMEETQAFRIWIVSHLQYDTQTYLIPHAQKSFLPDSFSRGHAAIFVREGTTGIRKALESYFQIDSDNYASITANGNLVVEGIESAGLQHDTSFDFDVALDLIEVIMVNYRHVVQGPEPVNWNLINIQDSLSKIRGLKQSSKPFTITFTPAHTTPAGSYGTPYSYDTWDEEHHEQQFSIVEIQASLSK